MKPMRCPERRHATAALLASLALAAPPSGSAAPPAVDPASLAVADSLLNLCTAMPDAKADLIRQQVAQMERGHDADELAQLRGSDAYQSALDSATDTLSKVDGQELKKVCAVSAADQH